MIEVRVPSLTWRIFFSIFEMNRMEFDLQSVHIFILQKYRCEKKHKKVKIERKKGTDLAGFEPLTSSFEKLLSLEKNIDFKT